jgi:Protein kinase domain
MMNRLLPASRGRSERFAEKARHSRKGKLKQQLHYHHGRQARPWAVAPAAAAAVAVTTTTALFLSESESSRLDDPTFAARISRYIEAQTERATHSLAASYTATLSKCESSPFYQFRRNKKVDSGDDSLRRYQTTDRMHKAANRQTLASQYNVEWRKPLGEGAFGAVYLAVHQKTGEKVAVKEIRKEFTDNVTFQREMDAMHHLRDAGGHPNVCSLREHFEEGDCFYLILDLIRYASSGTFCLRFTRHSHF